MGQRSLTRRIAVLAVALVALLVTFPRPAPAAGHSMLWSGQPWWVLSSQTPIAAGPNLWSARTSSVWVDGEGRLHLKIRRIFGRWYSAELVGLNPLGYGTYRWTVASRLDTLDRNVVLGLFTYDGNAPSPHRELDIEFSRFGKSSGATNAQYVVQPQSTAGNKVRFTQPSSSVTTHSMTWTSTGVRFRSVRGRDPSGTVIRSWSYPGKAPRKGLETPRISLWLYRGLAPSNEREVEVVIERFRFIAA